MEVFASLGAWGTSLLGYVVPFLFVLTLVVFFHELGHFWVARRAGVRVLTFSLGFGPEIAGFISVSAPANLYDFTFLAPCPSSGVVIHGELDKICAPDETRVMVERTRTQKGRKIDFKVVPGADHFFESHMDSFIATAEEYLDDRLAHDAPEGEYHAD